MKNKKTIMFVALWTLAVTILRALRLPNGFSQAHWLLDYQFGFIKRGLPGEMVRLISQGLGITITENLLWLISFFNLVLFVAMLCYMLYRIIKLSFQKECSSLMGVIFVSSPFIVMNAHLVGYFDNLLYLFTFAAIIFIFNRQYLWASLLAAIGILIHESFIFVGWPLIILALVLILRKENPKRSQLPQYLLVVGLPLLVFGSLLTYQAFFIEQETLHYQIMKHINNYAFVADQGKSLADYQVTPFQDLFQFGNLGQIFQARIFNPKVWLPLLPTFLTLLYFIVFTFKIIPTQKSFYGVLALILAPLVLHFVAWDSVRISDYVLGSAFFAIWIFAERISFYCRRSELVLGGLLLLFNIFGQIPLMNNEVERFSWLWRLVLYAPTLVYLIHLLLEQIKNNQKQKLCLDE